MTSNGNERRYAHRPESRWPALWIENPQRGKPKRYIRSAPLDCGHEFRSDVLPSSGERVWCWGCDDYRRAE